MVTLVLAANLFADGVRDAFDPRARELPAAAAPRGDELMATPATRRCSRSTTSKVALDADAGIVKAIDGLSLAISAARPSRWSANRAAARA